MEGATPSQSRPYWIRYLVAFWAGEELKWAMNHVLIACVCSLAPGLIAGGINAALSDDKWRAAAHATLLTYAGLFTAFLMWRLVATPLELDRERQRSVNGLAKKLAFARFKLAALRASLPAIDVEILELYVQATDTTLARHTPDIPIDRDIFLRVKVTLREERPIGTLAYALSSVLHGNSTCADYVDDIQDWGLIIERKPVGIGLTFHYTVSKLTKLTGKMERAGALVEGWLHFHVRGVPEKEIGLTVYRLSVLTPRNSTSADIGGDKNLARVGSRGFQKLPYAARANGSIY
jgi:hypothetical protein